MLVIYILLINAAFILINYVLLRNSKPGSDHFVHLKYIESIKHNGHKMQHKSGLNPAEPYMHYPQLYHYVLSLMPETVYRQHYFYINLAIKAMECAAFNGFLYGLSYHISLSAEQAIWANIIFNVFPFSFAIWNAKNNGLSARGIGLVIGQLFTYSLFFYVHQSNWLGFSLLCVFTFLSIVTSQMSFQFILLTIPFFALVFRLPEILLTPVVSAIIFFVVSPKVAQSFFIGQYNRKRNNALFQAHIFILKERYSIYRDFVFDFWIKLLESPKKGLKYIYYNPIIEVIYGFPYLWPVVYLFVKGILPASHVQLFYFIIVAGAAFFVTSFRPTRFLGEPQRYMEFIIPVVTVLFVLNSSVLVTALLVAFSVAIILAGQFAFRAFVNVAPFKQDREDILSFCTNYFNQHVALNRIVISNDNDLLKFFPPLGIDALRPNLTTHYKDIDTFNSNYHNSSFHQISAKALMEYFYAHKPSLLVINKKIYSVENISDSGKPLNCRMITSVGTYEVYELPKQA